MQIRAVLFDLDDTLIVDEVVSHEALVSTAEAAATAHGADVRRFLRVAEAEAKRIWAAGPCLSYCRSIGISAFECLWGKFEGASRELTALREWSHAYREQVFDAALREQLLEDPEGAEELARHFEKTRRKLQRLLPDALETVVRLKATYKIGLLTNGAPDLQREKIAASGLIRLFDAVAISGEQGVGKPRPEIFHTLLAGLGVTPSEAVMVGNSQERDIAGAQNAGILSIWIRIPGSEEHAEVVPTATISGLAQLPDILTNIQTGAIAV